METNNSLIEKRIEDLEKRVDALEGKSVQSTTSLMSKTRKMSAREFLMTKEIKTETQKTLALAFFLEQMDGMQSFNVADLESAFMAAKEKRPANTNDAVNKNIARGFIMEATEKKDTKKAWTLTTTGERFVDNNFIENK